MSEKVSTCEFKGYMKVQGAERPCATFQLVKGFAYLMSNDGSKPEIVAVTEKGVAAAVYTYFLKWVSGETVAIFEVNGHQLAQLVGSYGDPEVVKQQKEPPKPKVKRDPPEAVDAKAEAQETRRRVKDAFTPPPKPKPQPAPAVKAPAAFAAPAKPKAAPKPPPVKKEAPKPAKKPLKLNW